MDLKLADFHQTKKQIRRGNFCPSLEGISLALNANKAI